MGRQMKLSDFCESVVDERRVVRRDGDSGPIATRWNHFADQLIEELPVIRINIAFFLEGDTCRFLIGAFN